MRPLSHPPAPTLDRDDAHATAHLLNAFGAYCAVSELPLPDRAHAFHAARGVEVDTVERVDDWSELIVLDSISLGALRHWSGRPTDAVRLPHRDLTFLPGDDTMFRYALEDVSVVYLGDDGESSGAPVREQLVIVRSDDDLARRTIDAFALNTRYFDEAAGEFRIPRTDYLAMVDHRVHHRTRAWSTAERIAELISEAGETASPLILDQARHVAAATGFWSVWATVLWERFEDLPILRRILTEPRENVEALEAIRRDTRPDAGTPALGPNPHQVFPGTHPNALGS